MVVCSISKEDKMKTNVVRNVGKVDYEKAKRIGEALIAQERIEKAQERSERYQYLLDKGIPGVAALMLLGKKSERSSLPDLDERVKDYQSIIDRGVPEFPAAMIATNDQCYRYFIGRLDQIIVRYHELVKEGKFEADAANDALAGL